VKAGLGFTNLGSLRLDGRKGDPPSFPPGARHRFCSAALVSSCKSARGRPANGHSMAWATTDGGFTSYAEAGRPDLPLFALSASDYVLQQKRRAETKESNVTMRSSTTTLST